MRKILFVALGVLLLAGGAVSCQSTKLDLNDPVTTLKACNAYNYALAFMTRRLKEGVLTNNQIGAVDSAVEAMGPVCENENPVGLSNAALIALDSMIAAQLQIGE